MERKMIQLTEWGLGDNEIECQYGRISYSRYLELEAERIERNPERMVEIRKHDKYNTYALFVNCVAVVFNLKYPEMKEKYRGAGLEAYDENPNRLPEELTA